MKKIIFFTLIIIFFGKTQNVFGNTSVFIVDNIVIEGKINDQKYREKYLKIGFRSSFEKLINGIIRKKDQKDLLSTDFKTIETLISSYKILNEENAGNKYVLKITVKFNESRVRKYLQARNISYSEMAKLDMIVYPILVQNSELKIFRENIFLQEWNKNKYFENVNFILPVENLDDINFIKQNLSNLEEIDLSTLVNNYEIRNSAILILRYDKNKLNVFFKTNLGGVKKSKKVDFELENINNEKVRQDIIRNLKFYINELWKEENLVDISAPTYLSLKTRIDDINSLREIIEKIKSISLIDSYIVEELNNNSSIIKIKFFGKINSLRNSLIENGFELKILDNEWNLSLAS